MSNYESFEELKKDCKNFVDASKKRGAYDGIKKLLTELYPDKAHFLYELLQNAEDMWATEVMFTLTPNTLIFEHNGKKRDFTLDDISAITNVGQSPKRDDPTSIGQFGVGFKAVYAYTNTPEIHSGKYDFKIIDMLMPEDDGVKKCARLGFTQFIFPLGTETKNTAVALREIENGLQGLDENSILFLSHIKTIRYRLSNNSFGSIATTDEANHIKKVVVYCPNISMPNISYFLKFDKEVYVNIKEHQEKRLVSIAYRMLKTDNKFTYDPSLQGKVCIYFPAEKESNNLRFHINAPFASTVARDSVRDCPENKNLVNSIAELICESIDWIKDNKLWDRSIYAILPHSRDVNANRNSIVGRIQAKVQSKFLTSKLIQINQQLFVNPKECVQLRRAISKVFTNDDFKQLEGHYYILAAQPYSSTQPATNEIHFFTDLSIGVINEIRFIKLMNESVEAISQIVKDKPLNWICNFYSVLYDIWQNNQYDTFWLRHISMIPSIDGALYRAIDRIYIESEYEPKNIKNPIYINQAITESQKACDFLMQVLNIKIMSSTEDHLEEIKTGNSGDAISGMIGILEEYEKATDQEQFMEKYRDEPIFLSIHSQHSHYKVFRCVKASDCCWTNEVAPFYKKIECVTITADNGQKYSYVKCANILALDEYKTIFSSSEIEKLHELFGVLGGNSLPKIISCDVKKNPLCQQWVKTNKFRRTRVTENDYTITGLNIIDELVEHDSINSILLLWDMLMTCQSEQYTHGYFYPSENGRGWYGDSSLVYYLKSKKWIPDRNGKYHRPCEITAEDLPDGFVLTEITPLLKAIGFGDKTQQSIETMAKIKAAVPDANDQQQKLIALILEQPELADAFMQQVKDKERLGLLEALKKQNKQQGGNNDDEDAYGQKIGVKNPDKRQKKLQDIFEKGLQTPYKRNRGIQFTYGANVSKEEKIFVYQQYKGTCQICEEPAIRKYDGKPHFVAVNIVNTSYLKDELLTDISQGWNTLCLCPNCAAKYKYCAKNLDAFSEQVIGQTVEAKKDGYIIINIELQEQQIEIKFTPAHFLALQAAFNTYGKDVDDN